MASLINIAKSAKTASKDLALCSSELKDKALLASSDALYNRSEEIIEANRQDIQDAQKAGLSASMIDRLTLTQARIIDIVEALRSVAALPDPIGALEKEWTVKSGLRISRVRVPLGVIGIIYESRPNVTADAAAICIKTGNAALLRGGKEAIHSNIKIVEIMREAFSSAGLSPDVLQILEDTSRKTAKKMMTLNGYIDVLIPRGGAGLIQSVLKNATVPVIETGVGNCHVYVDKHADPEMGANIIFNAKTSRPSVCNAAETLLVHKEIAKTFLPLAYEKLSQKNVQIRGCAKTRAIIKQATRVTPRDYAVEFLDYILAVKVVDSAQDAITHIARYGTRHSEAIVTNNAAVAEQFLRSVDAAAVYHNASTRFTDGGEFGFGAEIGISTQKMHARGPMGLEELTSYKYVVHGDGQIR